jgi:hypothetical protein
LHLHGYSNFKIQGIASNTIIAFGGAPCLAPTRPSLRHIFRRCQQARLCSSLERRANQRPYLCKQKTLKLVFSTFVKPSCRSFFSLSKKEEKIEFTGYRKRGRRPSGIYLDRSLANFLLPHKFLWQKDAWKGLLPHSAPWQPPIDIQYIWGDRRNILLGKSID